MSASPCRSGFERLAAVTAAAVRRTSTPFAKDDGSAGVAYPIPLSLLHQFTWARSVTVERDGRGCSVDARDGAGCSDARDGAGCSDARDGPGCSVDAGGRIRREYGNWCLESITTLIIPPASRRCMLAFNKASKVSRTFGRDGSTGIAYPVPFDALHQST